MSIRLAWHWAVTAGSALALSTVLADPFPAPAAGVVGFLTAAGVGFIGYATTPTITRKDVRP